MQVVGLEIVNGVNLLKENDEIEAIEKASKLDELNKKEDF